MLETLILTISIILQFVAALLALRLIRITGRWTGWSLIAAAITLMAVRRSITLFHHLTNGGPSDLYTESIPLTVSMIISVLMAAGIAAITPLFVSMKKSEEALRRSEERFRSYFELGLIGMAITSPTKGILEVNDKICEILGYDRNELVKQTWAELTHPDDLAADVAHFNRVTAGEIDGYSMDKRFIRKDGQVIDSTISVKCVRRPDGSVDHFVALLQDITERKRAEETLRESEERLRLALEAAQMGTFDWDIPQNRITWSRGHEKLWDLAPGEFGGTYEAFLEKIHPDDLPGINAEIKRSIDSREALAQEFRVVWSDGSVHWVFGRGEFFFNEEGEPLRMRGVVLETTARRQAEEELRAGRDFLNNIIDSSPSYIFAQDMQHRITLCNDAVSRLFGMPKEKILGKTEQDLFPKNIADAIQKVNRQIMRSGAPIQMEEVIASKTEGSPRVVITTKFPFRDGDGKIGGLGGVATDITERKQAEEALKRSEERYRTLIEQASDGIFIADLSGKILDVNPSGCQMLNYKDEEIPGLNLRDILAPEDLPRLPEAISHLQTGGGWIEEWKFLRKDGTIFLAEVSGKALSDGRLLGIVRDITERKKAEKALRTSEERFQLAARATHDIIWDWDLAANTIWWNRNFYTLFGYKPEEIEPGIASWENRIHTEERERVITGIHAAIDRGERFWSDEYRFRRSDGSDATLLDRGYIVHDQGGKATRMIGAMMDITGRKQAEEALKQAEARLRLALQAGRIGTWDWNLTTEKIVWSSGHEALWGMAPGTFKGTYEEFEARLHPDDRDEVKRVTAQAIVERSNFRHEFRVVWPDGSVHWIAGQGEPLFDESGRPVRMIGVVRDITEPKRAEAALRESEERLRFVTLATHDAVWDWNLETNTIWWNEAFKETFGYKNEEVKPGFEFWESLIHPEDREHLLSDLQATIDRGEQSLATEYRLRRGDGSYATVLDRGFLLHDQNAKPVRMVGAMMDITEQKQAEEALRRSEQHLRDVINSLIFFAGVLTPEGIFVEANQTALNATGLSLEEVIGKPFDQIYAWSYSPEAQAKLRDAIARAARGETVRYDTPLRLKGDRFITIDFGMAPMFDAGGKVTYLVPSGVDITERKRAEEEIKKLNVDLERRVAERTAQLQTTNKELESFSYSVSHDLRAPLRGISGFSRVLLARYADRFDAQGKDFLQRVDAASRRMGELIEDLLNLSRITRSEMHQKPVDLSSLAKTIAEELQHSEPGRKVTIVIRDDLKTSGDPRLLRIALENLLGNAWKFTMKRPVATIEFGRIEREGKTIYFVRDDGAGFDMAYADKLFGPFQRLHSLSEFPGTGIGLATVQRIIHRHGGKVWAEGEVEKGATFYFTLG